MAEYISREEAIKRLYGWKKVIESAYGKNDEYAICLEEAIDKIEDLPAADVAPVIRCKDCDLWNEWDHSGRESLGNFRCSCAYWSVEDGPVFFTAPTDFCSYAEPKEEP